MCLFTFLLQFSLCYFDVFFVYFLLQFWLCYFDVFFNGSFRYVMLMFLLKIYLFYIFFMLF